MKSASFIVVCLIAATVAVAGLAVVAGWLGDVTVLKSLRPDLPSMKLSGAISFVLGGFSLYLMAQARRDTERDADVARTILPITTLCIMLLTIPSLASEILGFNLNVESLFMSNASGRLSLGAIVAYIIFAVVGLVVFDRPRQAERYLIGAGSALTLIGGLALLGYAIKAPIPLVSGQKHRS